MDILKSIIFFIIKMFNKQNKTEPVEVKVKAIAKEDKIKHLEDTSKFADNKPVKDAGSNKDVIMDYLKKAEGDTLHWNRGESNMTSPYGIYRKSFPHAKIFNTIDLVAKKNGLNIKTSAGRIKFNKILHNDAKLYTKLRNEAWELYSAKFMNKNIINLLGKKSALTFFSIAVNGGMGRAAKILQASIGARVDGAIGQSTIKTLKEYGAKNKDDILNQSMLDGMQKFYNKLIARNYNKYGRFKRGWTHRLVDLGYVV